MKKILSLTLAVVMVLGLIPLADVGAFATDTVTLSSGGDLNAAINNVEDGGTVTISGTYTLPSGFSWASHA